jgi:hypothetical protein
MHTPPALNPVDCVKVRRVPVMSTGRATCNGQRCRAPSRLTFWSGRKDDGGGISQIEQIDERLRTQGATPPSLPSYADGNQRQKRISGRGREQNRFASERRRQARGTSVPERSRLNRNQLVELTTKAMVDPGLTQCPHTRANEATVGRTAPMKANFEGMALVFTPSELARRGAPR